MQAILVHVIGDTFSLCRSFLQIPSDVAPPSPQWSEDIPRNVIAFHWLCGNWWCSEKHWIGWSPFNLKSLHYLYGDSLSHRLDTRNYKPIDGAVFLADSDNIESVKHCLDAIRYFDNYMPYVVAVKSSSQQKAWRNKIKILTDKSTLTYDPDDKNSIKCVWMEMIHRFELDADLEQRFLDCIDTKLIEA